MSQYLLDAMSLILSIPNNCNMQQPHNSEKMNAETPVSKCPQPKTPRSWPLVPLQRLCSQPCYLSYQFFQGPHILSRQDSASFAGRKTQSAKVHTSIFATKFSLKPALKQRTNKVFEPPLTSITCIHKTHPHFLISSLSSESLFAIPFLSGSIISVQSIHRQNRVTAYFTIVFRVLFVLFSCI